MDTLSTHQALFAHMLGDIGNWCYYCLASERKEQPLMSEQEQEKKKKYPATLRYAPDGSKEHPQLTSQ